MKHRFGVLLFAYAIFLTSACTFVVNPAKRGSKDPIEPNTSSPVSNPKATCSPDVYLSNLEPTFEYNVHGCTTFDKTYWDPNIIINGRKYPRGISSHAPDRNASEPNKMCKYFQPRSLPAGIAQVGWNVEGYTSFKTVIALADQERDSDGVIYSIVVDGAVVYKSPAVTQSTAPMNVSIPLVGAKEMILQVDSVNQNLFDTAIWVDARLSGKVCP